MKRNNSRKFKTPSFKWKKKNKKREAVPEPYAMAPEPSAPELTICDDSNLDFEDKQLELFDKKVHDPVREMYKPCRMKDGMDIMVVMVALERVPGLPWRWEPRPGFPAKLLFHL